MLLSVYDYPHYKDLIESFIGASNEKAYKTKLAAAAGCKSSYFSQVLKGTVHLTPEHAYGLAAFWRLTEAETEFFLLLVHHDRAGTKALRKYFEHKIDLARREAKNLATGVFKTSQIIKQNDLMSGYYSQWYGMAIHILLGIPGFQTVDAIAKRLELPESRVVKTLNLLQDLGLAQSAAGQWQILTYDIHLPKQSPLATPSHISWRHRAIAAMNRDDDLNLQFTGVNSVAESDLPKLRSVLMAALEGYRAASQSEKEEELVCLTLDFFRV